MTSLCVICSDNYPTVGTSCGHAFHARCIENWFVENDTCPACHSVVRGQTLSKLSSNVQDDGLLPSQRTDESATLQRACADKDAKIAFLEDRIKAVKDYANTKEEKFAEDIRKYQEKTERLEAAVKRLSSVERNVNNLEHENRNMRYHLEGMKNVQQLITGSQQDVQDLIDKYDGKKICKQVATISMLRKREMNRALESNSKLQEEVATLSNEKGLINQELQLSKKKICDLEQQIKNLEDDTPNSKRIKTMDSSFQARKEVVYPNELIDCSTPDTPLEQPIQSNIRCVSHSLPSTTNALSKKSLDKSLAAFYKAICPLHQIPSTSTSSAALPSDLFVLRSPNNFESIHMLPDLDIDRKPIPLIDITMPSASPSPSKGDNAS